VIFYDKKDKVVYSSPKGDSGEWNAILPNTVGEKINQCSFLRTCCSKGGVVSPKVEEPVVPKEAVVAPKVEEPATPRRLLFLPKLRSLLFPKEAVCCSQG